jgi:hypothetical protein
MEVYNGNYELTFSPKKLSVVMRKDPGLRAIVDALTIRQNDQLLADMQCTAARLRCDLVMGTSGAMWLEPASETQINPDNAVYPVGAQAVAFAQAPPAA